MRGLIVLVLALSLVLTLTIGDVLLSYQETKPLSPEKIRLSADVFSDLSRNMTTSTNGTG